MSEESSEKEAAPSGASPSSLATIFGIADPRVEIIADYLLRNYRFKPDRWVKFYTPDIAVSRELYNIKINQITNEWN